MKIPPNPNAIIAALCDIASAAYAVNHAAVRHPNGAYLATGEDIDLLRDKLALLESLPQMADNESFTGPRRARGWLASFLVGEVALNFDDKQLAELKTALNQARSTPLLVAEFEHSMREYQDAELLRQLREMCGYVENGSEETVSLYQDDATRDWTLRVGTDNTILKSKARRYHASSFHQVIRVAAEKEIVDDEPEPEECKFCGITTPSPCDAPPTDTCAQALAATIDRLDPYKPAAPSEKNMKRDRMKALLLEVAEKITRDDAKRIIAKHGHPATRLADIPADRVQAVIDAAEERLRLLRAPLAPAVPAIQPEYKILADHNGKVRGVQFTNYDEIRQQEIARQNAAAAAGTLSTTIPTIGESNKLYETLHKAGEVLGNQDPVVSPAPFEGGGGSFDGGGASGDFGGGGDGGGGGGGD